MSSQYGPLVSPWNVEQAVISMLRTPPEGTNYPLIVYYLAEVERQNGRRARSLGVPAKYRGGTDFTVWRDDEPPLIVVIARPVGELEYPEPGVIGQYFEVQLGALVQAESQDEARELANHYGIALAKAVQANGTIGPHPYDPSVPLGTGTKITDLPVPEFAEDADTSRNIMRGSVTFRTLVQPVLEWGNPSFFPADPYRDPGDWPTVTQVNVTVDAVPITVPDPPSGG